MENELCVHIEKLTGGGKSTLIPRTASSRMSRGEQGLLDELARCNRQIQNLETHFLETNQYGKLLAGGAEGGGGTTLAADGPVAGIDEDEELVETTALTHAAESAAESVAAESIISVTGVAPGASGAAVVESEGATSESGQRIFTEASCTWWDNPTKLET